MYVSIYLSNVYLDTIGRKYTKQTKCSKTPNPSNPNFLEHIMLQCELPENPVFTTPLEIRVIDERLGGYLKPLVAVGSISLEQKLPWAKNYRKPQSDMFANPGVVDEADFMR
jgi:hypothetical protein